MSSCCEPDPKPVTPSCCATDTPEKKRPFDWLLWGSSAGIVALYLAQWLMSGTIEEVKWVNTMASTVFELMNTMWWGVALGILFVGLLSGVPREFVMAILGHKDGLGGILRATAAGVFLDLCSHGILMVGAKLYERGASTGQVVAFLVASPWNSLSLTLILVALIGLKWTLLFILFSLIIGVIAGLLFEHFVKKGVLPANPNRDAIPEDFEFWRDAKAGLKKASFSGMFYKNVAVEGLKGSRMVLRWVFFGVLMAGLIRTFVSADNFAEWFGPSFAGLVLTMIAATIIEVCSEGSTPIAADLVTRASAPGNGFAFLMTGVATDYTEIMVLKETTKSWKIALFLPLLTVPQVLLISWLINVFGT